MLKWSQSATIGFNAPITAYYNDPLSGNNAAQIACTHLSSPWNNILYDLQPDNIIKTTTPQPSAFIGKFIGVCAYQCYLPYIDS